MPLRLGDGWRERGRVGGGNWRLPGEPAFAASRGFELLKRDLYRYVREEIAGRSFLIAGHRGAGKTASVTQAVREIRNDILVASPDKPPFGRRGRLQRPLFVKLVGKSLIAPPPELKLKDQETEKGKEGEKTRQHAPAADSEPKKPKDGQEEEGEANESVASALVHLTIALYRALAAEVAEGFSVHALSGPERQRSERLELAAQLALELDGTPEPATLRNYWDRLGRLDAGVLWPPEADKALQGGGLGDQGFREVIAVATAAQAFQVCSGAVTYTMTQHDTASHERKAETNVDVTQLVTRLGALGAGVLAGGAVAAEQTAARGIGTGLLVWLLSSVALHWTSTRQRKSERTLNYTFLRDRSIQTLDRDLPLVIARIRDAGLAPVFVIDELDKLDQPTETIADIISRLKHLVSDHGFFCFLTDRNYFDVIEAKVAKEAYPTEHTYFGERVLIVNRPDDLLTYVRGLVLPDPAAADAEHSLRTSVFALAAMFRSKLNFSDLSREIDQLVGPDNSVIVSDQDLQAPGRLGLEATIQLAINEVLSADDVQERFAADPGFAQLAIDVLYHIPRRWQANTDEPVSIDEAALKDALLERRAQAQGAATAAGKGGAAGTISPPELRELAALTKRLAGYLADFASLKLALSARPTDTATESRAATDRRALAPIVIEAKTQLIKPIGDPKTATSYQFTLDELARVLPDKPTPGATPATAPATIAAPEPAPKPAAKAKAKSAAKPGAKPTAKRPAKTRRPTGIVLERIRAEDGEMGQLTPTDILPPPPPPLSTDLLDAMSELISTTKLSISDLVAAQLLPPTLGDSIFEATLADLRLAEQDPKQTDALRRADDGHIAFAQAFNSDGDNLAHALVLLALASSQSGEVATPGVILPRLARYLSAARTIAWPPIPAALDIDWAHMEGTAGSIRAFASRYESWLKNLTPGRLMLPPGIQDSFWIKWRDEVSDFLRRGRAMLSAKVDYADLVLAARQESPGNLFRASLIDMDQLDWSRVTRMGLVHKNLRERAWLQAAGLVALGFDRGAIERCLREPPWAAELSSDDRQHVTEILRHGRARPTGILHVVAGDAMPKALEIPSSRPMLSISQDDLPIWQPEIGWLVQAGLIDEGRYEIA